MLKDLVFVVTLLGISASPLLAQQVMQDVVYLNNGSVIHGTIIEQIPSVSIKIRTIDRNVFVFAMDEILKITKESYEDLDAGEIGGRKSPGLAFALSFIIPGLGQYYNGNGAKGVIQEVVFAGGLIMIYTLGWENIAEYESHWNGDYYEYEYYYYDEATAWLYVGAGLAVGAAVWSMIDAPMSAGKINKEREQSYGHLMEFNRGNNVIGLDLSLTQNALGTNVSYHF